MMNKNTIILFSGLIFLFVIGSTPFAWSLAPRSQLSQLLKNETLEITDPEFNSKFEAFYKLLNEMFTDETSSEIVPKEEFIERLQRSNPKYILKLGFFGDNIIEFCGYFEFKEFIYIDYVGHVGSLFKSKLKKGTITSVERKLMEQLKKAQISRLIDRLLINAPKNKDILCEVERPEDFSSYPEKYRMAQHRIKLYQMAGFQLIPTSKFSHALSFDINQSPMPLFIMIRPGTDNFFKKLIQSSVYYISKLDKLINFMISLLGYTKDTTPPSIFKLRRGISDLSIFLIGKMGGKHLDLNNDSVQKNLSKTVRQMLDQYPATRDMKYREKYYDDGCRFNPEKSMFADQVFTKPSITGTSS